MQHFGSIVQAWLRMQYMQHVKQTIHLEIQEQDYEYDMGEIN